MCSERKIFMNERIVVLTDNFTKTPTIPNEQIYFFENQKEFTKRLGDFEKSDDLYLFIVYHDLDELFRQVAGCFKYIEAAGGIVTLPDGRILLIERLGKWDLPKGKVEKGETLQETAIREVVEECGLKETPKITGELTHTFHTYHRNGRHILKHTAWFTMLYEGDDALHPQSSEDITQAVWLPPNRLNIVLQNTYESIKSVFNSYKLQV